MMRSAHEPIHLRALPSRGAPGMPAGGGDMPRIMQLPAAGRPAPAAEPALSFDRFKLLPRRRCMRGFKSFASAERFCRCYDGFRNFLRAHSRHNQHVSAHRRRLLHLRRATAALATLGAA